MRSHCWNSPLGRLLFAPAAALAVLLGCGGDSGGGGGKAGGGTNEPAATATADGIKQINLDKLPKIGDPLPPQDGGRITPAGPEEWQALTRDNKFVARFALKKGELPRIEITSAASPFASISDVNNGNVADFNEQLQASLKKPGRKIVEPCKPLKIGDRYWSRHVRLAKYTGSMAQVQSLQTVVNGRLVAVDLLVDGEEVAELQKFKDYGYTVAGNLQFGGSAGGNPTPEATPEPMPTETPKPADPDNPTPE